MEIEPFSGYDLCIFNKQETIPKIEIIQILKWTFHQTNSRIIYRRKLSRDVTIGGREVTDGRKGRNFPWL